MDAETTAPSRPEVTDQISPITGRPVLDASAIVATLRSQPYRPATTDDVGITLEDGTQLTDFDDVSNWLNHTRAQRHT